MVVCALEGRHLTGDFSCIPHHAHTRRDSNNVFKIDTAEKQGWNSCTNMCLQITGQAITFSVTLTLYKLFGVALSRGSQKFFTQPKQMFYYCFSCHFATQQSIRDSEIKSTQATYCKHFQQQYMDCQGLIGCFRSISPLCLPFSCWLQPLSGISCLGIFCVGRGNSLLKIPQWVTSSHSKFCPNCMNAFVMDMASLKILCMQFCHGQDVLWTEQWIYLEAFVRKKWSWLRMACVDS